MNLIVKYFLTLINYRKFTSNLGHDPLSILDHSICIGGISIAHDLYSFVAVVGKQVVREVHRLEFEGPVWHHNWNERGIHVE